VGSQPPRKRVLEGLDVGLAGVGEGFDQIGKIGRIKRRPDVVFVAGLDGFAEIGALVNHQGRIESRHTGNGSRDLGLEHLLGLF